MNIPNNEQDVGRRGFLKASADLIGIAIRFMYLSLIVAGALIAHYARFGTLDLHQGYKIALLVVLFGTALLFPLFDLYKRWHGMSITSEILTLLLAWLCVITIIPVLVYFTKTGDYYSRIWFGLWILVTAALFAISRVVIRRLSLWTKRKGYNLRNVLVVGAGELGQNVIRKLAESGWAGVKIIGFLDDDPALHGHLVSGVPVLGHIDRIKELIGGASSIVPPSDEPAMPLGEIDQIWIALPISEREVIRNVCIRLEDSAVDIVIVPDLFLHGLLNHSVDDVAGMPIIDLRATPMIGAASTIKLVEDVLISVLALSVALPLMILIAIGIKLESPGPILFKQKRYGLSGKEIVIWKFRSMCVMEDGDKVVQAVKNDPRTTRLGAFLRKTSLDELPQFFNVLQGRMSVVGPRPHAVAHNEQYRVVVDKYMWRFRVKPGITGWAQVNGWRGETEVVEKMEKRIQFDLEYVMNWSIWLDIKIVFQTIFVAFFNKDVY